MIPSQSADKFVLRLPDGMRDLIKVRAAATRRTMNSMIIHALDRVLAEDENNGPASVAALPGRGSSISKEEKADEHGNT